MGNGVGRSARARSALAAVAALLGISAIGAPPQAAAGTLTLASGDRIETRGEVRIDRGRVVFRTLEGNLRSLPLSELAPRRDPGRGPTPPAGATSLREYPSDAPRVFEPPAVPQVSPLGHRARSPEPPRCWLANGSPGEAPDWICDEGEARPRGAAPAQRGGAGVPEGSAEGASRPAGVERERTNAARSRIS